MIKSSPSIPLLGLLLLVLAFPLPAADAYIAKVKRVIDGDTLLLANGTRVRLIGIDTPEHHESKKLYRMAKKAGVSPSEIQKQGKISTQFVKSLIENKPVRVSFDPVNEKIGHRDRFGRLLAYIHFEWNPEEGERAGLSAPLRDSKVVQSGFLNGLIVLSGYGEAYTRYPFRFQEDFTSYEKDAKAKKRGLWNQP